MRRELIEAVEEARKLLKKIMDISKINLDGLFDVDGKKDIKKNEKDEGQYPDKTLSNALDELRKNLERFIKEGDKIWYETNIENGRLIRFTENLEEWQKSFESFSGIHAKNINETIESWLPRKDAKKDGFTDTDKELNFNAYYNQFREFLKNLDFFQNKLSNVVKITKTPRNEFRSKIINDLLELRAKLYIAPVPQVRRSTVVEKMSATVVNIYPGFAEKFPLLNSVLMDMKLEQKTNLDLKLSKNLVEQLEAFFAAYEKTSIAQKESGHVVIPKFIPKPKSQNFEYKSNTPTNEKKLPPPPPRSIIKSTPTQTNLQSLGITIQKLKNDIKEFKSQFENSFTLQNEINVTKVKISECLMELKKVEEQNPDNKPRESKIEKPQEKILDKDTGSTSAPVDLLEKIKISPDNLPGLVIAILDLSNNYDTTQTALKSIDMLLKQLPLLMPKHKRHISLNFFARKNEGQDNSDKQDLGKYQSLSDNLKDLQNLLQQRQDYQQKNETVDKSDSPTESPNQTILSTMKT